MKHTKKTYLQYLKASYVDWILNQIHKLQRKTPSNKKKVIIAPLIESISLLFFNLTRNNKFEKYLLFCTACFHTY